MSAVRRAAFMVASALDRLGLPRALAAARRRQIWKGLGLTIVAYHRVADPTRLGALDPELVDATPEAFERQMTFLRENFRPVSLDEVLRAHRERQTMPPDSVLVTFDDGYRDNHDIAFPILQRLGVPATFFLTTGYLNDRRLFWWERINLHVQASQAAELRLDYPAAEVLDLSTPAAKAKTKRHLTKIVKDHYALDVERFLDGVSRACGVSWSEDESRRHGDAVLMTWDNARAMRAAGMSIGSHTSSHRVLQTLTPADLAQELSASRAELTRQLGEPITTIAYPVGRSIAGLPAVRQALAEAGYELGFTAVGGINRPPPDDDAFDLRRLMIDRGLPEEWTRWRVALPLLN